MSNNLKWNENSIPNENISRFVSKTRDQAICGYREKQREVYGPKTYELLYGEGGLFERLAGKKIREMMDERKE